MSTPKSSGLTVFQRLVQQLAQHMELKYSFDSDAAYVLQLSIEDTVCPTFFTVDTLSDKFNKVEQNLASGSTGARAWRVSGNAMACYMLRMSCYKKAN